MASLISGRPAIAARCFSPFDAGDLGQRLVRDIGLLKDRAGNRDVFVARQAVDDVRRRIADRRQPAAQFGERRAVGLLDQPADDVVENGDVLVGKRFRTIDEQIGHAPQHGQMLRARRALQRRIELRDQ